MKAHHRTHIVNNFITGPFLMILLLTLYFIFGDPARVIADNAFVKNGDTYSYIIDNVLVWTYEKDIGINNDGKIVAGTGQGQGVVIDGSATAFFQYPGADLTNPSDINNAGVIVGTYRDSNWWSYGFIKDGNNFIALGDGTYNGINNAGQIVGSLTDLNGYHGFIMDGKTYTLLDYPGAIQTYATGINDAGFVVGHYTDKNWIKRGFLYDGSTYIPLDYPRAHDTYALDINNVGEIVGYYTDSGWAGPKHGFLIEGNTFSSFDVPNHGELAVLGTIASGINDDGTIVGSYEYRIISEPATMLLLGLGLIGVAGIRRKFNK